MRRSYLPLLLASLLIVTPLCHSQNPDDAENCKDSPIITRMPGSKINSCENKEFEQASFPLKPDADGNGQEKKIEGEYHTWDYRNRDGMSEIQVYRNMETALKRAGFTIDYGNEP